MRSTFFAAALALWQHVVATTSSTATPTKAPNPTNTFCPVYYTTPVAKPKDHTCGVTGFLDPSVTFLSQHCGSYADACYYACARDPKCVSFSLDPYNRICTNYGKSLATMGFKASQDTNIAYYSLRGCWECHEPLFTPKKSFCPNNPVAITPSPENYTCGARGITRDQNNVNIVLGLTLEECYRACAGLDENYNVCQSFSWNPDSSRAGTTCSIYLRSLYQKGFKKQGFSEEQYYNLRGCFACNLTSSAQPTCVPKPVPVNPIARNGNFSLSRIDKYLKLAEPRYWIAYEGTKSVVDETGNTYVSMHANFDDTRLLQNGSGFDRNPASSGRFYNLTFDIALKQIYTPKAAKVGCHLNINYIKGQTIRLANSTYGPNFKRVGPLLLDAAQAFFGWDHDGAMFILDCFEQDPVTDQAIGGNATIAIDNVFWSQHGRVVGDV